MKPLLFLLVILFSLLILKKSNAQSCIGNNTLSVTVVICEGIHNESIPQLTIVPNPSGGLVHIRMDSQNAYRLELIDITGKIVYHEDHFSGDYDLETASYSNGIYVVRVYAADKVCITKKLEICHQ